MAKSEKVNVGLVSVGLSTYWPQFDGLLERLLGYKQKVAEMLESCGACVVDAGMVDTPQKGSAALQLLNGGNLELTFVFVATYSLSSIILPVAKGVKTPILILNVQPAPSIDYIKLNQLADRGMKTGEWLAHCQACAVPELACVLKRAGIPFDIVTGYMGDVRLKEQLEQWLFAAHAVQGMRNNRLGVLGHYYNGMLDVYADAAMQSISFGTYVQHIEMCELKALRDSVEKEELKRKLREISDKFVVSSECDTAELYRAASTSIALDKLVDKYGLGSLAYYYEGYNGNEYEDIVTSLIVGNTLLTGRGVPVAGECELRNAQAMKILSIIGAGGSFSEPYALDFNDDVMLWGHDGPAHFAIAEGSVGLVPLPLYHGKPGKGLSIQMSVKHGPVTFLSVCESGAKPLLLVAEAESVEGPVLEIGNTNSRYKFQCGVRDFIDRWCKAGTSHHCAIGLGHVANIIEKFAFIEGVDFIRIC